MEQEKTKKALMKYSAIAPLITGNVNQYESKEAFFRSASEQEFTYDGVTYKKYSAGTIKRWYLEYVNKGFDELKTKQRSDINVSRKLSTDAIEYIHYQVENYPRKPSTIIYQELITEAIVGPKDTSLATVNREVKRKRQLMKKPNQDIDKVMARYERENINEVWCGDSSFGPNVTVNGEKRKTHIIAFIDDCSRFIVGIDIYLNDNTINLINTMKQAVKRHGVPKMFNFDNGSNYKSIDTQETIANIHSSVHYCHPYSPVQKAKIERFFGTMKKQWMSKYNQSSVSLEQVKEDLLSYVEQYNNTVHSSLNGKTPNQRFFDQADLIKYLDTNEFNEAFMVRFERQASIDRVVTINSIEYELDPIFANKKVKFMAPAYKAILVLLLSSLALLLYKPKDYSPYVSSILYLLRFVLIGLPFAFKHVYDDQKNKVKIIPYAFIVICNFILLFS